MNTRILRTVVIAAGLALVAATAVAQEPAPLPGHRHLALEPALQHFDATGRVQQLDERIAMLKADMGMFAGEMKIQVMADLIEALIERQYVMERTVRPMHEMMEEWMPHSRPPAPPSVAPDAEDMAPEAMCSPYV